jgi:ATP-dependent RNA helicase SUPV3L1/SUV3
MNKTDPKQWMQRGHNSYRSVSPETKFLEGFTLDTLIAKSKNLDREFIVLSGPTNSGKTYRALQYLKAATSGVYLGPLRLLALEISDELNKDGVSCNLLTGEESIQVFGAQITASTIEMCDFSAQYDVAVIDECQMIGDRDRGHQWTKAILGVRAKKVILCTAGEAKGFLKGLLKRIGAKVEIVQCERLCPLEFGGVIKNIRDVEPGDCLVAFSRKSVLAIAAALERIGVKASMIYGALPPASRREEVRRFTEGETTVVVATDAIGMGVSLPIRRIIFCQTEKFDGITMRNLKTTEILQIAGRAGRFGKYPVGYVCAMKNPDLIESALYKTPEIVSEIKIPFPLEAIDTDFDLLTLLKAWSHLPAQSGKRADVSSTIKLYETIRPLISAKTDKHLLFSLITCPIDENNNALIMYWVMCCRAVLKGLECPHPTYGTKTLANCELMYKAYDIRHQVLRRVGIEDDSTKQKEELCEKINEFLKAEKSAFLLRCSRCGKPLPVGFSYGMCTACYRTLEERRMNYDF